MGTFEETGLCNSGPEEESLMKGHVSVSDRPPRSKSLVPLFLAFLLIVALLAISPVIEGHTLDQWVSCSYLHSELLN